MLGIYTKVHWFFKDVHKQTTVVPCVPVSSQKIEDLPNWAQKDVFRISNSTIENSTIWQSWWNWSSTFWVWGNTQFCNWTSNNSSVIWNGIVRKFTIDLPSSLKSLSSQGNLQVLVKKSKKNQVIVTCEENIFPLLSITFTRNNLELSTKTNTSFTTTKWISITVEQNYDFSRVSQEGSWKITIIDQNLGLELKRQGSWSINILWGNSLNMIINSQGSGSVICENTVVDTTIVVSGSGFTKTPKYSRLVISKVWSWSLEINTWSTCVKQTISGTWRVY